MSASSDSRSATDRHPAPSTGLASRLLARMFFRQAVVADNVVAAPSMHLITLEGAELRDLRWAPGDKLQIRIGSGMATRTYTPLRWDPVRGSVQILAHALAAGPGSEWVRRAAPGDAVSLAGPRRSLALSAVDPQRGVIVGDETVIGLAAAWRPAHALFEASNQPAIQALLDSMGLQATAMTTQANEIHLDALSNAALCLDGPDVCFVLAGRAQTVRHVLRTLRAQGVSSRRILTKGYWAEGKTGLD